MRPARLLGADREDLFALNLDFNAERGTNVAALNNGATNPNVAGKTTGAQRIKESATAGIANERMVGVVIVVIRAKFFEIGNVFQLTIAIGSSAGESPITGRSSGRAAREANDGSGDVFAGEFIAKEEIGGGPGLGKIGKVGDHRVSLIGVRKRSGRVGRRRGNFDLWSGLDGGGLGRFRGAGNPVKGNKKNDAQDKQAHDERKKRIAANGVSRDTRNIRHFRLETGR